MLDRYATRIAAEVKAGDLYRSGAWVNGGDGGGGFWYATLSIPDYYWRPISVCFKDRIDGPHGWCSAQAFNQTPIYDLGGAGTRLITAWQNEYAEIDTFLASGGGGNTAFKVYAKSARFLGGGGGNIWYESKIDNLYINTGMMFFRSMVGRLLPISDVSGGYFLDSSIGTAEKVDFIGLCDSNIDVLEVVPNSRITLVNARINKLVGGNATVTSSNSFIGINESSTVLP